MSVKGIAHDKIELELRAPSSISPDKIRFEIYINFSDRPQYISGDSINEISSGTYIHTIENLKISTEYAFQVSMTDMEKNIKYDLSDPLYAKTFSRKTSNFSGAISATPLPGKKGETMIKLKWTPAETSNATYRLKDEDPIAYEITYVEASQGVSAIDSTGVSFTYPSSLSPRITYESEVDVAELTPNTKYFFRVRAINYGYYADQNSKTGLNYRYEKNNQIVSATTNVISTEFGLLSNQLTVNATNGFDALNSIDVAWNTGVGGFLNYRLYIKKVEINQSDACSIDIKQCSFVTAPTSCNAYNSSAGEGCLEIDSTKNSATINGLDPYEEYQVVLAACGEAACLNSILSDRENIFTYPRISAFEGISNVELAKNSDEIEEGIVHLNFQSIDTDLGYLDNFAVWCFHNPQSLEISELSRLTFGSAISNTGSVCDQASLKNKIIPSNINDWPKYKTSWSKIESATIALGGDAYIKNSYYCFGITPYIETHGNFKSINIKEDGSLTDEARKKMIVRCFRMASRQPTVEQFPGKKTACKEGVDEFGSAIPLSLNVSYNKPTGGIYSHFRIFIKSEDETVFNFESAKSEDVIDITHGGDCPDGKYCFVDVDKDTFEYNFTNLVPTKRYVTAVLPVDISSSGTTFYGESNTKTGACQVKVPTLTFNEWTNIISLGPKTDSRFEVSYNKNSSDNYEVVKVHIPERLNDDFIPIEITDQVENFDYIEPDVSDNQKVVFSGIFNNEGRDWSKNGIIHLEWKDVNFGRKYNSSSQEYEDQSLFDSLFKKNAAIFNIPKPERAYGYRVLRSIDNGVNWVDLTSENIQTQNNKGLIYPCHYTSESSNQVDVSECQKKYYGNGANEYETRIVNFTDYSVLSPISLNEVDRARVYLYKIELVYDNLTIPFDDEDQIIRVILPPANMALAHRKIINRTICLDLTKDGEMRELDKSPNGHYSCVYNGIGSSSLSVPWSSSNMVYDIGGDLLIDRFELGCNWTRGDNEDWTAGSPNQMPDPLSLYAGDTKGCVAKSYEDSFTSTFPLNEYPIDESPGLSGPEASSKYKDMRRARKGDCIGTWRTAISADLYGEQGLNDTSEAHSIISYAFPGAFGGSEYTTFSVSSGGNANKDGHYLQSFLAHSNSSFPTLDDYLVRAELGAVLYNRNHTSGVTGGYLDQVGSENGTLNDNTSSDPVFKSVDGDYNKVGPKTTVGKSFSLNTSSRSQTSSRCWINLGHTDKNDGNKQKPRWFSISQLLSHHRLDGGEVFDIYYDGEGKKFGDFSLKELKEVSLLYDSAAYSFPENSTSRYYDDLNIIRIMTTNASKAPPIVNVNQEESNKICNKYKVSVGIKPSDEDDSYFEIEKKEKRLPSKKEFIAFSSWPDTFDKDKIQAIETRTFESASRVDSLSGNQTTGCNINSHTSNGNIKQSTYLIEDGDFITSPMPSRVFSGDPKPLPLFFSGSSQFDPNGALGFDSTKLNYNSESCISKFGIQDVVGNIVEKTADRIFCNFNEREMYIQTDAGDFDKSKSILAFRSDLSDSLSGSTSDILKTSFDNLELPISSRLEEKDHYRYLISAKISNYPLATAHSPMTDNKTYCHVFGSGHTDQATIQYLVDSVFYNPIEDMYKTEVDRILLKNFNHFNLSILNDLRNGDGTFLDFGSDSSVGEAKKSVGLVKYNDIADSDNFMFFNPVVGMPLTCGASCDQSPDNILFADDEFHFGGASFENSGVNQIRKLVIQRNKDIQERHIISITPNSAGHEDDEVTTDETIPASEPTIIFSWEISRGSYFSFRVGNGAHYKDEVMSGVGRYSFSLGGANGYSEEVRMEDTGIRCMVKVNEIY